MYNEWEQQRVRNVSTTDDTEAVARGRAGGARFPRKHVPMYVAVTAKQPHIPFWHNRDFQF